VALKLNYITPSSRIRHERRDGSFAEIDDYFEGNDDDEGEVEKRRLLLRLLCFLRPQLAELFGGPADEWCR